MWELLNQLGLRNPGAGWWEMIVFTIAAGSLIVGASIWTDNFWIVLGDNRDEIVTPRQKRFYWTLLVKYPLWGTVQQALVFLFLLWLRNFLPPEWLPWAPPLAALIFAFLHFPNFHLMFTVGFMVSVFVVHMDLHHNLLAIGVAHGVLGTFWKFLPPRAVSTKYHAWSWYVSTQKALQAKMKKIGKVTRG